MEEPIKKKRGRKTKLEKQIADEEDIDKKKTEKESVPKKTTKRGRKPKTVYSSYDIDDLNTAGSSSIQLDHEDENIIVKLTVNEDPRDSKSSDFFPDKNVDHPYAYNRDEYANVSNILPDEDVTNTRLEENHAKPNQPGPRVVNLLKDFEAKNKNSEWPSNTSISCYWCCHEFDNAPLSIPMNYNNITNMFDVYGCFCSLECAAAFNFEHNDNIDEMWERYSLINLLNRKLGLANMVHRAPPKLSLKKFGGYLSIDKFRNFATSNKIINTNFPPMTSITQQIEEINEYELTNDHKYIPLDNERITRYKDKINLKRIKPIVNGKHSLEASMNLKYST